MSKKSYNEWGQEQMRYDEFVRDVILKGRDGGSQDEAGDLGEAGISTLTYRPRHEKPVSRWVLALQVLGVVGSAVVVWASGFVVGAVYFMSSM